MLIHVQVQHFGTVENNFCWLNAFFEPILVMSYFSWLTVYICFSVIYDIVKAPLSLFMVSFFFLFGSQVLKFLMERNSISALHGQVTVGTLILQVYIFFPWYHLFNCY